MAHLVRDDALQFLAIQRVDEPACDGNRRVAWTAPRGERIRIGIRNDVHRRPRQPRRDRHFVDDVVELTELELVLVAGRRGDLRDRRGMRREQHRAIAGVVADERGHRPDAQREHRSDGKRAAGLAEIEGVEAETEQEEKGDEGEHDDPCSPPVHRLLLEEVHGR